MTKETNDRTEFENELAIEIANVEKEELKKLEEEGTWEEDKRNYGHNHGEDGW